MEGSMGLTKAIRAVCRMELGPDTWALPTVIAYYTPIIVAFSQVPFGNV